MNEKIIEMLSESAQNDNTIMKALAELLDRTEKMQAAIDFLSGKQNK